MSEAAFPVKASNNTRGFRGSSSAFTKISSAHLAIASIVSDFPTPEIIFHVKTKRYKAFNIMYVIQKDALPAPP